MGSVCCTASRARDMAEVSDGWSMEQTGQLNVGTTHGALSPPPVSSSWDRKSHFSEIAANYKGLLLHRTASSSAKSYRSNSISSGSRTTSSHRRCETVDGLLAVFNSPSESFRYSQQSLDHIADSVTIGSEPVWRNSAVAPPSQEESGGSASSTVSSKAMECYDGYCSDKHAQDFPKSDLSTSSQNMESSQHFSMVNHINEMTSPRLLSYQQMLRNSVDVPSSISRQRSGPWRTRGFPELMASTHPRSSRWLSMGIPSNVITDVEQEDLSELYIRSTVAMYNPDISTPQVESPKCGLCSKSIVQKSLWNFPRSIGNKELPVVGILECGHVYHAECLDRATPITQAHDPPCPKCEDQKRVYTKVQEESLSKSRTKERPFSKGKLSRVGVAVEELGDAETNKRYRPVRHQHGFSENLLRKGSHNADNSFLTKSLLRKQFSFRGKMSREATGSGLGSKRPGFAARVSPENSIREDDLYLGKRVH